MTKKVKTDEDLTVKGVSARLHICPTCSQSFYYRAQLEKHLLRTTGCSGPETILDITLIKIFHTYETALLKYYEVCPTIDISEKHRRVKAIVKHRHLTNKFLENHGENYDEDKLKILKEELDGLNKEVEAIIDALFKEKREKLVF